MMVFTWRGDWRATGWLAGWPNGPVRKIKTKVWNGPSLIPAGNEAADRGRQSSAVCPPILGRALRRRLRHSLSHSGSCFRVG